MSRNSPHSRRAFLKKAVATTGTVGALIGSAGSAAASHDDTRVEVSSLNGTGSYSLFTNEEDSNAHGSDLETGDAIDVLSGTTRFEGTIHDTDDEDVYYYTGELIQINLTGSIRVDVFNPTDVEGTITVSGDDDVGYNFCVDGVVTATRDTESCDTLHDADQCVNGCIDPSNVEDHYDVDSPLLFAESLDSGSLTLEYDQDP